MVGLFISDIGKVKSVGGLIFVLHRSDFLLPGKRFMESFCILCTRVMISMGPIILMLLNVLSLLRELFMMVEDGNPIC